VPVAEHADELGRFGVIVGEGNEVRRLSLIGLAVAAMTLAAGPALATPPGPGVTGTVLTDRTIGSTRIVVREITIPPGQSTGWHYHDGPLRGFVKSGTLSHFDSSCHPDGTYRAGKFISEPPGTDHVHIGRNLGKRPVVLVVKYILPVGAPFSEDAANPGCAFE
jgi:quercetin dioxygenase-like cupin family protein